MAYRTGRTRTLTFSGAWGGSVQGTYNTGTPPGFYPWSGVQFSVGTPLGAFMLNAGYQGIGTNGLERGYNGVSLSLQYSQFSWPGSTLSSTSTGSGSYNYSGSGSWSAAIDVEEWVSIAETAPTTPNAEMPPVSAITFYEEPRVGGNMAFSAAFGPCSISGTRVIQSGDLSSILYDLTLGAAAICGVDTNYPAVSADGTATLTLTSPAGFTCPFYTHAYTGAHSSGQASVSAGTLSCTAHRNPVSGGDDFALTSASWAGRPDKAFNVVGKINAMYDAYPDALTVVIDGAPDRSGNGYPSAQTSVSGGAFAYGDTLRKYSVSSGFQFYTAYLYGYTDTGPSANEDAALGCHITPASLLAIGEDSSDTRILLRGWHWPACTVSQKGNPTATDGSLDVDATPKTANWMAGSNTGVSGTGPLTITVNSSGMGSVSSSLANARTAPDPLMGSSWQGVSFAGYRFLRLYLTVALQGSETSQPARLVLGGKQWTFQVKGSGSVDLDLCCPTNLTPNSGTYTVDSQDTQWEWTGAIGGPYGVADGQLWGVSNVGNFVLDSLALGHTYTLTKVQLVRKDHSALTLLPGYRAWVQAYPSVTNGSGTTTTTYYRRFADGDTDGRRSLERTDYAWINVVGGGGAESDTYPPVTIAQFVASLHGVTPPAVPALPTDGWDATDLAPAPTSGCPDANGNYALTPCFLNSDRDSTFLYGGGVYYDGKAWQLGFNINVKGTTTLPAQVLCDTVYWYPGCGDGWNWSGGAYGGTFSLAAAKILRSQAMGLVWDTNLKPTPGITVVVTKTSTATFAGKGVTADVGEYKTGKPYPFGSGTYTVTAQAGNTPYPSVTEVFTARKRQRVCFSGVPVPTCCKLLFCSSDFYWPFGVQAGDGDRLPLEEWRRITTVRDTGTQQAEPVTATTGTASNSTSTKGNG